MGFFTRSSNSEAKKNEAKNKKKEQEEKEQHKKDKKEREWKDLNESNKYVCQGGKIECKHCSDPTASILVTSNDVMLQDKPWLTTGDMNGKVNFPFQGLCTKVPGTNKPPCISVISLTGWKKPSKTYINNNNAIRMDSYIKCAISNDKLKLTDSGQRSEIEDIEDVMTDGGLYFVDGRWTRDIKGEHITRHAMNGSIVYFQVDLKNTDKIADKAIEAKLLNYKNENREMSVTNSGSDIPKKYWNFTAGDKITMAFRLGDFEKEAQLFLVCRIKDKNGKEERIRFPKSEDDYLNVYPSICMDRYKVPGLNSTGIDIADDMTFGYGKGSKHFPIYYEYDVNKYKEEYKEEGFNETKHNYFANTPKILLPLPETQQEDLVEENWDDPIVAKSDKTNIVIQKLLPGPETKMMYLVEDIEEATYSTIPTGKMVEYYRKYIELKNYVVGNAEDELFETFTKKVKRYFDWGELSGNIEQMINKFRENKGGVFETEQLSNSLSKNEATTRYCDKINGYISHVINKSNGDISALVDNNVYFQQFKDVEIRISKKKTFGNIAFSWSLDLEGVQNILGGRTIALNDIWARELYLESFDWVDEYRYKVKYKIILWDHFGLDKPDLEKMFNILPEAWEIFACWFLLQHRYGYRPFITKASFSKEFEGDVRQNLLTEAALREQSRIDAEQRKKEEEVLKYQLQNINIWDIKW